jgi:hypothetical protein
LPAASHVSPAARLVAEQKLQASPRAQAWKEVADDAVGP